jgi:prevent-host-death family protein
MRKRTRSRVVDLYDAKRHLAELVDRAARCEEIVIAKSGSPHARLVPLHPRGVRREPGGWEGRVWISEDFDAPLPAEVGRGFAERSR